MSVEFRGQKSGLESQTITTDPQRGISSVQTFNGSLEEMLRLQSFYAGSGTVTVIDGTQQPIWRLRVQSQNDPNNPGAAANASVDSYELLPNYQTKDWRESPRARALGAEVLVDIVTRIEKELPPTGLVGDARRFYHLIRPARSGNWSKESFTFKFTKVVSPTYTTKMAFSNLEKIYTTSQLKAEVQPPQSILFSLDDIKADSSVGGTIDIPEIPGNGENARSGWLFGWFKHKPSHQVLAGNRIAITQEFTQVEASTLYYSRA